MGLCERPLCSCGNLVERIGTRKDGTPSWGKVCRSCRGRTKYGVKKSSRCEECGFVPKVPSQLQIDHVDGDRSNNDPSNLRTLCCNCHAYKSYVRNDVRFQAARNPFFGKRHTVDSINKIKESLKSRSRSKSHDIREEQSQENSLEHQGHQGHS